MTVIDLHDVQGNLVKPYGRYGYPLVRYGFLRIRSGDAARHWLQAVLPHVTTGAPWPDRRAQQYGTAPPLPEATLNLAFSAAGLAAIGVPEKSLDALPEEFRMGMRGRCDLLGDDGPSAPKHWDPIWQGPAVHVWVSINARAEAALARQTAWLQDSLEATDGGVELLAGHRGPGDDRWQDAGALTEQGRVVPREHFGFVDGISDPYFEGCGQPPEHVIGEGKPQRGGNPRDASGWAPLATGEFVLGYPDEADEYPLSALPQILTRNGTFLVYRKLHQNVASWRRYMSEMGRDFPGGADALAANMAGRWPNGAPLSECPDQASADAFMAELERLREARRLATEPAEKARLDKAYARQQQRLKAFNYADDLAGGRCPVGAHIRRANPRGALEYGQEGAFRTPAALTDRRRLLRRGLPYGSSPPETTDADEHGIILMVLNASIKRQFEFVQQKWINYGNDFRLGNERDPLVGNQPLDDAEVPGQPGGHYKIPGGAQPPWFCARLPRFVETRGGDYFFLPSLSALHMLAAGNVDPT